MVVSHVHVSRSNTKLGEFIPSVNLSPRITCRPDAPCFKDCYATHGRFLFAHNRELMMKNLQIWLNDPVTYEADVTLAAFMVRFFRYHSAGDIPDAKYLAMMCRIANRCQHTSFLCFTKKYELINDYIRDNGLALIPQNLHIVLSAWGDKFQPENPWNLPMAYIDLKNEHAHIPENARPCSGFCGDCVQTGSSCWDLKPGESVVFKQH